ncbi:hypothetical protein BKA83DRAFT_3642220 [Pisolithus microcarpus]|nr:hypothetical protein BKA83DRAFT_3642220 [Pisolithus microcarpus]
MQMHSAKAFILLAFSAYVCAQQSCAACPDIVSDLPLVYGCSVDDHTHCGYNEFGGIVTSGPVCIYTVRLSPFILCATKSNDCLQNEGSLIPAYSDPDICPDNVGSTSNCIPCISF